MGLNSAFKRWTHQRWPRIDFASGDILNEVAATSLFAEIYRALFALLSYVE